MSTLALYSAWRAPELVVFTASVLLLLVLWRLWKFTIAPLLTPQAPRQLPYGIPFLGHGIAFFRNANALLTRASKEPFAVTIFGATLYVITKPEHTIQVYKNTQSLSFEVFVQTLMRYNGLSDAGLKALYAPLPKDKLGFPNPHGDSLGVFIRQINIHQLYPGDNLEILDNNMLNWMNRHLNLSEIHNMDARSQHFTTENKSTSQVPLMQWCSEFLVRGAGHAYFGDTLDLIDSKLAKTFLVFDELGWQIMYHYPGFLTKKLGAARHDIRQTLKRYFQMPRSQRDGSVWLIKTLEDELRSLKLGDDDIATVFLNVYWGINTNTRKLAFWMLLCLLQNSSWIDTIREETAAAFRGGELIDLDHLFHKCPHTDAIWHEALRHCSNAASIRLITEDTVIGGKVLRKGERVLVPYRLLHFDRSVYGEDVHAFNPDRFAGAAEKLTRGPSWRPFGGGKTLCSGRYAAKHASLIFVALVLRRFDISVAGKQKFPEPDLARPVLGITSTKGEEDIMVEISPRLET